MADERDPTAAMKNREAAEQSGGQKKNFTDAFDAPDRQGKVGPNTESQHRAAPGEGVRAPLAQESGGQPQYSSFDSKGNERVVVLSENEKGNPAKGTGPDAASAQADAETGDAQIGDLGPGS